MNANNDSITSSKTNRRKQSAVKLGDLIGNQKKITARSSKAKYAATLRNIILKIKKCK